MSLAISLVRELFFGARESSVLRLRPNATSQHQERMSIIRFMDAFFVHAIYTTLSGIFR